MLASGPVAGVLAGWAFGGRLSRLADLRIAWWPLLAAAVALRLAAGALGELATWAYVLAFVGIAAVAIANRSITGMWAIAAGSTLNLAVVAANGGMPVDQSALAEAGGHMPSDRLHIPLTEAHVLAFLGDRIPVAPFRGVYSAGDLLLTLGGFLIPFVAMRRR